MLLLPNSGGEAVELQVDVHSLVEGSAKYIIGLAPVTFGQVFTHIPDMESP